MTQPRTPPEAATVDAVHRDEAGGLEGDPPRPVFPQLAEDGPGDIVLRGDRIEMGADRRRSVREGAAEREIGAGAHVLHPPARLPVPGDCVERAHERAVRVGGAGPDMALVEMGVHVREGGEGDGALHVDHLAGALRHDPVLDGEVERDEALLPPEEPSGGFQVGEGEAVRGGEGEEGGHVSLFNALSCHFRKRRCERSESAAKITTPMAEMRRSAA